MQINRFKGDTYADKFIIGNSSSGEVVNISGCSFLLTLNTQKNPSNTATQLYQITGVITDAVNGVVEFAPTSVQAAQAAGLYYFDVQMIDSGGVIRTLVKDVYVYEEDITKN